MFADPFIIDGINLLFKNEVQQKQKQRKKNQRAADDELFCFGIRPKIDKIHDVSQNQQHIKQRHFPTKEIKISSAGFYRKNEIINLKHFRVIGADFTPRIVGLKINDAFAE